MIMIFWDVMLNSLVDSTDILVETAAIIIRAEEVHPDNRGKRHFPNIRSYLQITQHHNPEGSDLHHSLTTPPTHTHKKKNSV
jgi:hypothetical protein